MIKDTLNPDFVKKFVMDYFFEESQKLKFEVWVSLFHVHVNMPVTCVM